MLTAKVVGERINYVKKIRNLNTETLCKVLQRKGIQIDKEALSKIEEGKRIISVFEIKKLADMLDVYPMYFLGENGEDQNIINKLRHSDKFRDDEECLEEIEEVLYFARSFIRQKVLKKENFSCELP